jgi:SAM-dependent MidA family methyltransferase
MYEHYLKENFGDLIKQTIQNNEKIPVIIIAHEFFDALPINIFQVSYI